MEIINTDPYAALAIVLGLTVLLGYLYQRLTGVQTTIAVMASSLLISLVFVLLAHFHWIAWHPDALIANIPFRALLLKGMLGLLLFASSLQMDMRLFKLYRLEIACLAFFGTIFSTLFVGALIFYIVNAMGMSLSWIEALLFGALISPTDPIAVLATFKKLKAPKSLVMIVSGESLFNDGVAIVIFLTLLHFVTHHTPLTAFNISMLFLHQAIGGVIAGFGFGWLVCRFMRFAPDSRMAILLTLMIATGGYTLANELGLSGALAMVVAGIMVGNFPERAALKRNIRKTLNTFWEIVDELLNVLLFSLLGLEMMALHLNGMRLLLGIIAIGVVLIARCFLVIPLMQYFKRGKRYMPYANTILIWSGLRGGLAVALVLAIPSSHVTHLLIVMTYVVVSFSVLIQGGTIRRLTEKSIERRGA